MDIKYAFYTKEEKHILKQQVMTNGALQDYKKGLYELRQFRLSNQETYQNPETGEVKKYLTNETESMYLSLEMAHKEQIAKKYSRIDLIVAMKVTNSRYEQSYRIRKRITPMVESGNSIFGTLTFTDDVLATTSEKTRSVYVARYLKSQNVEYVANIDYGDKKGREHYHFVSSNRVKPKEWLYGALNVQKIAIGENSVKAIPQYISKLTNHAIKQSTKRPRLIVSRKPKTI